MAATHVPGFPRIGPRRELKRAVEAYWRGAIGAEELERRGRALRAARWDRQREAGLDFVAVGDFAWYDAVLETSALLGAVPERFGAADEEVGIDTLFRMARGRSASGPDIPPCEMTKWFDTNYHYIVPELTRGTRFALRPGRLLDELGEAEAAGHRAKPVLLGPVTYLRLAKAKDAGLEKLALLEPLVAVYAELLERLAARGVAWVQLDEPALALDLPGGWREAFGRAYGALRGAGPRKMVACYFGGLGPNREAALALPVEALHVDAVCAPEELEPVARALAPSQSLSVGIVDGRNVWRAELGAALARLEGAAERLGRDRLWIASSCSLLHVPVDLALETALDPELRSWLAFAEQKLGELALLRRGLLEGRDAVREALEESRRAAEARRGSPRVRRAEVRERVARQGAGEAARASPYRLRAPRQRARLGLPLLPTTTIGSFPQTRAIRRSRARYRRGRLRRADYEAAMRSAIDENLREQEHAGLDVLVHGEPERSDMVEYFAERLEGFAITGAGWVQSFGTACVKPPLLYGDALRPAPLTVEWARYAQSRSGRPVKGMLTGPVTLVQWSFVRDDLPRSEAALQLALALRDEVAELEAAGIGIVQIDEPAFREGLPLRRAGWAAYLDWAAYAFRLASGGAGDATQIHTHMCYAEFNDIIHAIAELDADVITIEASRSGMELLDAFVDYEYPNEIGPGVYDIHAPRVPSEEEMVALLEKAAGVLPPERLWVNPDCGLKTREPAEVRPALAALVSAARRMRRRLGRD